jgi:hypothetical protein
MSGSTPSRPARTAGLGVVLTLVGIVSYFVVAFRFGAWLPWVRNSAAPNLGLVIVGLGVSVLAAGRAIAAPRGTRGRRLAPALGTVNVLLAAAFLWILYGLSAVPLVSGPALGAPAPDFALVDQYGHGTRLAEFRGAPLLLVFYRGHW